MDSTRRAVGLAELRDLRSEIMSIASKRKAKNVRVYGSVARGEETEASDVDFLVEMAPDATLIDLVALEQDLSSLLGRPVDVTTDDAISPLMRDDPRTTSVKI